MNLEELKGLIRKVAKMDPKKSIGDDADLFQDLGIDSLTGLKILAEVEQKYGVTIPDDRLSELNTPRKIEAVIQSLKKG